MAMTKDKPQDKVALKAVYTVIKACFLGDKNAEVTLNTRQADNLVAGGFIVPGKASKGQK